MSFDIVIHFAGGLPVIITLLRYDRDTIGKPLNTKSSYSTICAVFGSNAGEYPYTLGYLLHILFCMCPHVSKVISASLQHLLHICQHGLCLPLCISPHNRKQTLPHNTTYISGHINTIHVMHLHNKLTLCSVTIFKES